MALVQRAGGGVVGLGGTIGARAYLDEPGQRRILQPSVLFGLGTGVAASGIWYADIETPVVTDDFWVSHALTSIPAGLFFLAFPKRAGKSTTSQLSDAFDTILGSGGSGGRRGSGGGTSGGSNGSSSEAVAGNAVVRQRHERARGRRRAGG